MRLSFSAPCFDNQLLSRVLNSRHRAVAAGGLIGMVMHCIGWSWKLLGAEIFDRTSDFGLQWRWGPATSEAESDEFHVGDVSSVRVISWLPPQCAYDNQNHGGNDVLNHYFLDVFVVPYSASNPDVVFRKSFSHGPGVHSPEMQPKHSAGHDFVFPLRASTASCWAGCWILGTVL